MSDTAEKQGHTDQAGLLRTLFHGLEERWRLDRTLNNSAGSESSGVCAGVGLFTPRPPSQVEGSTGQGNSTVEEMLYQEQGQFQMQSATSGAGALPVMTFSRSYVWRMGSSSPGTGIPALSLWFTKPGTEQLDYLFHELSMDIETLARPKLGQDELRTVVRAHGSHLCVEDQYETDYAFALKWDDTSQRDATALLEQWTTLHTVKGPKKTQRIETTFTKDSPLTH